MAADDPPLGAPVVRTARVDDGPRIAAIVAGSGWADDPEPVLRERAISLVPDAEDPSRQVLVGEVAGEVAGFVNVTWSHAITLPGPEGYVTELFVHPELRGRGLGSALLDAVEDHARVLEAIRLRLPADRAVEAYVREVARSRGLAETTVIFERRL